MQSTDAKTQETFESRVEVILIGIKDAVESKGGFPVFMCEFDLAKTFVNRFADTFMFSRSNPKWHFRQNAGPGRQRFAHFEVRHACMRMISILTTGGAASGPDRARLETRKTVENVLEIASWDPRCAFHEEEAGNGS
ncbi:MAG: hypothetical protein F4213_03350 [Boseongicola sp. SB0677_bin_26]|nr:hypothetical protein [Boseongicola sp. SB0665_bin_10]MYG25051.1 hypothetical protein [Boseongicola sp. SB0677_bin_26]